MATIRDFSQGLGASLGNLLRWAYDIQWKMGRSSSWEREHVDLGTRNRNR